MHSWTTIIVLTVVFAFAVEFRPIDHYTTAYLTGPRVNITVFQFQDKLTWIGDYSNVIAVLTITLTTDYLLYKPVMLFNVFCGILVYVNFVMIPDFFRLKVAEICAAVFKSNEVVLFSYMFARIHDKRFYQATSGLARTALLLGKFCSSAFAQTLVFAYGSSYVNKLPCYSLGSVVFAFVWASFLPPVKRKRYNDDAIAELMVQHNNNEQPSLVSKNQQTKSEFVPIRMWKNFNESYKNKIVLKWSIWYCLALVGYTTIKMSYVTHRFEENGQTNQMIESMTTLIGAISSYKIGVKRVNWKVKSNVFIGSGSLILGVCVISCYFHQQILAIQLSYILFGALIQAMFVISLSETAKQIKNQCYALVLCFNSFVSLVILLCYREFFVRGTIIKIGIPEQILFFGSLYIVVGTIYLIPCAVAFNNRLKNSCPVFDLNQ